MIGVADSGELLLLPCPGTNSPILVLGSRRYGRSVLVGTDLCGEAFRHVALCPQV